MVVCTAGHCSAGPTRPGNAGTGREANAYRQTAPWHTATGVWLAVGFLFLAGVGLTWSAHAGERGAAAHRAEAGPRRRSPPPRRGLRRRAGASTPVHHGHDGRQGHQDPTTPSGCYERGAGHRREAGLDSPVVEELKPAAAGRGSIDVSERASWPTQVDSVAVDRGGCASPTRCGSPSGAFPRSRPVAIAAHVGAAVGLPSAAPCCFALAAAIVVLVVSGYSGVVAAPPGPEGSGGAVRSAAAARGPARRPGVGVASAGAGNGRRGAVRPLLGLSLLGFLAVDLLLGLGHDAAGRRRGRGLAGVRRGRGRWRGRGRCSAAGARWRGSTGAGSRHPAPAVPATAHG
ncbi:PepSY-associated TM helix domain-containing protein [Kocuria rhizophila]|nr:PepSY-associated TM helix domain-containing protein [Kocuria rhizophila]